MSSVIRSILGSSLISVPFPVAVDGISVGRQDACEICVARCNERACLVDRMEGERDCSLGVRYNVFRQGDAWITIYSLSPDQPAKRDVRVFKGRRFPRQVVEKWKAGLQAHIELFDSAKAVARTEALDSIHDISRLATELAELANKAIPAGKIENAAQVQVSILKTAELLLKEFDRLELLLNPASASAGTIYSHIYRLAHKYALIMDIAWRGRNKRVAMLGKSQMELRTYESISILVFALIENAAKYCMPGERVEVEVNDRIGGVDLEVRSVGPLIEHDEIPRLFDRGFRGKWARRSHQEGRGMGLHLAKIVADAHRTSISVASSPMGYERESVPAARNSFIVRIPSV